MNRFIITTCVIISCLLMSCEKEETPVCSPTSGAVQLVEVGLGVDYRNQLFFDLQSSSVISENLKTEWDLGFECSDEGWRIITNTAKAMFVANSEGIDFSIEVEVDELQWIYDNPNGDLNETAVGDWMSNTGILIIDRGYDWSGVHQGYKKLHMQSLEANTYHFAFSDIDGSNIVQFSLEKNGEKNFQCFSFSNGGNTMDIQPKRTDWDLLFTQYLESIDDGNEIVNYLVTGVLMNHDMSFAVLENEMNFEDISLELAQSITMSTALNEIGYDWKYYDFDSGTFIVDTDRTYIIKDSEGIFFKIRFVDFYNLNGEKGYPSFELQQL